MADWFYGKDSTQHGPVPEEGIRSLLSSGQIDTNTIIWREGMSDWIPLKEVPEFQSAVGSEISQSVSSPTTANQPYTSPNTSNTIAPVQYAPVAPTDTLAIVSLVCGILAIVACYIWMLFGIPAVICGHMSIKKINRSNTPLGGKGMAIAGLIMGYIGIAFQLLMIIVFIFAFASGASAPVSSP